MDLEMQIQKLTSHLTNLLPIDELPNPVIKGIIQDLQSIDPDRTFLAEYETLSTYSYRLSRYLSDYKKPGYKSRHSDIGTNILEMTIEINKMYHLPSNDILVSRLHNLSSYLYSNEYLNKDRYERFLTRIKQDPKYPRECLIQLNKLLLCLEIDLCLSKNPSKKSSRFKKVVCTISTEIDAFLNTQCPDIE